MLTYRAFTLTRYYAGKQEGFVTVLFRKGRERAQFSFKCSLSSWVRCFLESVHWKFPQVHSLIQLILGQGLLGYL